MIGFRSSSTSATTARVSESSSSTTSRAFGGRSTTPNEKSGLVEILQEIFLSENLHLIRDTLSHLNRLGQK